MFELVTGKRGLRDGWPLAIVGSLGYIAGQLPVAIYLGPYLPDVIGAIVCFSALLLLLKVWRPKTVRGYGGQLTPLAQESVLLAITEVLKAKKIQFVVVRSTNSLDQIFLAQFLRRSIPETRVVIDGADMLFRRGAEGAALRTALRNGSW